MNLRTHTRALAGVLAALWVLLPVATAVHGAVEAHEFCVEHQSFEHEGHGHDHAEADGVAQVHEQDPAGDAHAACAFDEARLTDAPRVDADTARIVPPAVAAAIAALVEDDAFAADVLAAAPKTSPPFLPTV